MQVVGQSVKPGDLVNSVVGADRLQLPAHGDRRFQCGRQLLHHPDLLGLRNSTAEWVAEAPTGSSGLYPLPNYHSWTETGSTVAPGALPVAIPAFPDIEVTMENSAGSILSLPGAELSPKTWYGMPAYANADGKVVVFFFFFFFQNAGKFSYRSRPWASRTRRTSTTVTCGRCRTR